MAQTREERLAKKRAYRDANKEDILKKSAAYRAANKEDIFRRNAAHRARNREKIISKRAAYYVANREKALARAAAWAANNPDRKRKNNCAYRAKIRSEHRSSWSHLPIPTRPRPDVCECCGKQEDKKVLAVDHCHTSGMFRGWLCLGCNMSIGRLGDSIEGLMNAVRYLQRAAEVKT